MTLSLKSKWFILGIPLFLLVSMILLLQSQVFQNNPTELARGITLDLVLTIPLVYFFLIRKRKDIPNISALSVLVVCLFLAGFILPEAHQSLLSTIKTIAIPVIELSIFSFILYKTREVVKAFPANKAQRIDFFDALTATCVSAFPGKIGNLLATEIAVIYYLFKRKSQQKPQAHEFTYFKKSGIRAMMGAFIGLVIIETFAVHFLVIKWYPTLAWVLTALSCYTCIQIIALLRSLPHRLFHIDTEKQILHLKFGFFSHTSIPLKAITSIEKNRKSLPSDKSIRQFSPLGHLDSHNIVVKVNETLVLHGLYGMKKSYNALAIYVDQADAFMDYLNTGRPDSDE